MIIGHRSSRAEKKFRSLTKLLFEQLQDAIVSGKLQPGERLLEAKLAASFKVEAFAVREVLRKLEAQGYVTFQPDNQAIVSKPTNQEIEDHYAIAGVLEGLAARLAVERARPEEVQHLTQLHHSLKEASQKRDLMQYFRANNKFHRAIADIARNERLYRLIDQLRQDIQKTRILALRLPERLDYSMREHDQILDAFLKKNSQLAESAMVRHLTNHMKTLQQALENVKGEKK
ncbi:MAG TPA: GntR family transcriptional regulator [Candidatus Binatia bacterium]